MPDTPLLALNDGRALPAFGAGTWQIDQDDAADVVRTATAMGYRLIDTAKIYGNETGVGEALADAPDIFLSTKLWNSDQGYDEALAAFDASLARLGRDSVDLYLIHWPVPSRGRFVDSWRALVRLREEGRAKSIGVSNFLPQHIEAIADATGVMPAVNQIELHPRYQRRDLRAFHAEHGIVLQSWSPLGQGELLTNPLIARIAEKHERTPAQVILAWHLAQQLSVIPKASSAAHLEDNLAALTLRLDAEDLHAIDQLDDPNGRMGEDALTM